MGASTRALFERRLFRDKSRQIAETIRDLQFDSGDELVFKQTKNFFKLYLIYEFQEKSREKRFKGQKVQAFL